MAENQLQTTAQGATAIERLSEPENFQTLLKVAKWYNPDMPDRDLEARVMQEIGYFEYALMTNDALAGCDPRSILMMMRWVIQNDLSIDGSAGLMYLKTRNIKQSNGGFIKVLEWEPSAEGALSIAYSTGEIIDHKRPKVHYDGSEKPKVISVDFEFQLHNGRWETVTYSEGHFRKWRVASHENNARGATDADFAKLNKANKSYTSFNGGIDPEFCSSKAITHGLDKRGMNRIAPKARAQAAVEHRQSFYAGEKYLLTPPVADPTKRLGFSNEIDPLRNTFTDPSLGEQYAPLPDNCTVVQNSNGEPDEILPAPNNPAVTPQMISGPAQVDSTPVPIPNEGPFIADTSDVTQQQNYKIIPPPAAPATTFTPDPIYTFLANCETAKDLVDLFSAYRERVLSEPTLQAQFKARELAINEARIAAEKASAQPTPTPAAPPKITANDL